MRYFIIEGKKIGISKLWTRGAIWFFLTIVILGYVTTVYLLGRVIIPSDILAVCPIDLISLDAREIAFNGDKAPLGSKDSRFSRTTFSFYFAFFVKHVVPLFDVQSK